MEHLFLWLLQRLGINLVECECCNLEEFRDVTLSTMGSDLQTQIPLGQLKFKTTKKMKSANYPKIPD
jgi:hypothetical protein